MKLQPVIMEQGEHIQNLLEYYMGKNSPQRQDFIIDNLRVELDLVDTPTLEEALVLKEN
jgi:topoisomerase-4 subunit B